MSKDQVTSTPEFDDDALGSTEEASQEEIDPARFETFESWEAALDQEWENDRAMRQKFKTENPKAKGIFRLILNPQISKKYYSSQFIDALKTQDPESLNDLLQNQKGFLHSDITDGHYKPYLEQMQAALSQTELQAAPLQQKPKKAVTFPDDPVTEIRVFERNISSYSEELAPNPEKPPAPASENKNKRKQKASYTPDSKSKRQKSWTEQEDERDNSRANGKHAPGMNGNFQ